MDEAYLNEPTFHGLPVVAFHEVETHFPPAEYSMFVAVGHQKVNTQRSAKMAEAEAKGYRLVSYLSSRADVPPDLKLGPNTMVIERVTVYPFVAIGRGAHHLGPESDWPL